MIHKSEFLLFLPLKIAVNVHGENVVKAAIKEICPRAGAQLHKSI